MLDEELRRRALSRQVVRKPLLGRRIVAASIDIFICLGGLSVAWQYQTFATPDATGNYGGAGCLLFLASMVVWLAYFAGAEGYFSRTLGKALAGIKVVSAEGGPATLTACVRRHLLDLVDFQLFGLPAILTVALTPTRQRLGDLWAGTVVVRDEAPAD